MTTMQTPPPTAGHTPQTTLMPLDPAGSPLMATRILPIRANLLPDEITAGRNARRIRGLLIGAVVLTVGALGGWYMLADQERDAAGDDLASTTQQVGIARNQLKDPKYTKVTEVIDDSKKITADLKIAMATDLPWGTVIEAMRTKTGVKSVTLTDFNGMFVKQAAASTTAGGTGATTSGAAAQIIANLNVSGTSNNKSTIADYLDAVAKIDGVVNVYLTTAQEDVDGSGAVTWKFTFTADVTSDRLCGRFTTACKIGDK